MPQDDGAPQTGFSCTKRASVAVPHILHHGIALVPGLQQRRDAEAATLRGPGAYSLQRSASAPDREARQSHGSFVRHSFNVRASCVLSDSSGRSFAENSEKAGPTHDEVSEKTPAGVRGTIGTAAQLDFAHISVSQDEKQTTSSLLQSNPDATVLDSISLAPHSGYATHEQHEPSEDTDRQRSRSHKQDTAAPSTSPTPPSLGPGAIAAQTALAMHAFSQGGGDNGQKQQQQQQQEEQRPTKQELHPQLAVARGHAAAVVAGLRGITSIPRPNGSPRSRGGSSRSYTPIDLVASAPGRGCGVPSPPRNPRSDAACLTRNPLSPPTAPSRIPSTRYQGWVQLLDYSTEDGAQPDHADGVFECRCGVGDPLSPALGAYLMHLHGSGSPAEAMAAQLRRLGTMVVPIEVQRRAAMRGAGPRAAAGQPVLVVWPPEYPPFKDLAALQATAGSAFRTAFPIKQVPLEHAKLLPQLQRWYRWYMELSLQAMQAAVGGGAAVVGGVPAEDSAAGGGAAVVVDGNLQD